MKYLAPLASRYRSLIVLLISLLLLMPEAWAADDTKVTWAWGATLSEWAQAIGAVLGAVIVYGMRQLPSQVVAILNTMRVEQMLQKGIDYGVNAVAGAAKDKTLTVDVGNKVLAEAAQYVLNNAPDWLQKWMGGPDEIVKKIFARLNLEAGASAPDTQAVLDQTSSTG